MFSPDDTIVAIATPAGHGGIGVVRISGPDAVAVGGRILARSAPLAPRYATFTHIRAAQASAASIRDSVVATWFPAPHSATGEDVVEISAHGSPIVLHGIVRAATDAGARLARPGEFTFRGFLRGKLDLIQAEAVADLIAASTPLQAHVACDQLEGTLTRRIHAIDSVLFDFVARLEASLDFPDEGYHFIARDEIGLRLDDVITRIDAVLADAVRGRMIREGANVVITGRPNVGKSSLFNALLRQERAIVTAVPGTTRDLVTERLDIEGLAVTLVDTAGDREAGDVVEQEGVARGIQARAVADVLLVVLDASAELTDDDERLLAKTASSCRLIVANKIDLSGAGARPDTADACVSAAEGTGIEGLRRRIAQVLTGEESLRDRAVISNARHVRLLTDARDDLSRARRALEESDAGEEFLLIDIQSARRRFDEIVGTRTSDDVLTHIFEKFCIGK